MEAAGKKCGVGSVLLGWRRGRWCRTLKEEHIRWRQSQRGAVVLTLRTEAVLGYGWKGEGGDEAGEVWG